VYFEKYQSKWTRIETFENGLLFLSITMNKFACVNLYFYFSCIQKKINCLEYSFALFFTLPLFIKYNYLIFLNKIKF